MIRSYENKTPSFSTTKSNLSGNGYRSYSSLEIAGSTGEQQRVLEEEITSVRSSRWMTWMHTMCARTWHVWMCVMYECICHARLCDLGMSVYPACDCMACLKVYHPWLCTPTACVWMHAKHQCVCHVWLYVACVTIHGTCECVSGMTVNDMHDYACVTVHGMCECASGMTANDSYTVNVCMVCFVWL